MHETNSIYVDDDEEHAYHGHAEHAVIDDGKLKFSDNFSDHFRQHFGRQLYLESMS
jgi:hypothetical protein